MVISSKKLQSFCWLSLYVMCNFHLTHGFTCCRNFSAQSEAIGWRSEVKKL